MKLNLYNKFTTDTRAYTLVELSVVLLIIGILSGIVMAGSFYLEQAKITKVISELNLYKGAVKNFIDKYQNYPGDMASASTTINSSATDGNGNERIDTDAETFLVWQHLNLAGFIDKTYVGGTAYDVLPKGPIEGSFYAIRTSAINGIQKTYVEYGSISNPTRGYADVSVLTPVQALTIDQKIDNGIATSGDLLGVTGLAPITFGALAANSCSDSAISDSSKYNMANSDKVVCKLIYLID